MTTATHILGPDGPIAARLPHYEPRAEQIEMAGLVERALADGTHLIVEAGTGVGKSFAYLAPAIRYALATGSKVAISTNTISLQEQLVNKDIPFLRTAIEEPFEAVLVKGRSNYLCLRRLERVSRSRQRYLQGQRQHDELDRIEQWAYHTKDGSRSDLDFAVSGAVWANVCSEHNNCRGSSCSHPERCFFQRARRRMHRAHILVVNHHLFFSDLQLRRQGVEMLPPYSVAIFDEAHALEETAAAHLGLEFSSGRIAWLLDTLFREHPTPGGLLDPVIHADAIESVAAVREAAVRFVDLLRGRLGGSDAQSLRVREPGVVNNTLDEPLKRLALDLKAASRRTIDPEQAEELLGYAIQAAEMQSTVAALLGQTLPHHVYWIAAGGARRQLMSLKCSPVRVGEVLHEELFGKLHSCILTSATLAVGHDSEFAFLRSRLGLDACRCAVLGSPFDYGSNVRLHLVRRMPDPNDQAFVDALAERIPQYVEISEGRALVLFTSYRTMRNVYERAAEEIGRMGYRTMMQEPETSRSRLLEAFRDDISSVLFGTESFWQGIDVPGESLSCVIVTRLPFTAPDDPLRQARMEDVVAGGGNAFMNYSLPEAVLRFKQGFGRLVRRGTDRGAVVVLDSRILTRRYGKVFLDSIPQCSVVYD